jgi:peptidoglycan/LPS O-acetylase OafA/YrhL
LLSTSRNQSLDVLRCVAVLLVLAYHVPYYPRLTQLGWTGVDLFFVLSGFLISGLLFEEFKRSGRINFGRFFIRRGLKIWPPFFYFVWAVVISQLVFNHRVQWVRVIATATFLQNYLGGLGTLSEHTWSLAVEEHFYIALPLLLIVLLRQRLQDPFESIPAIFAALAVICLILRWRHGYQEALMTHLRIDSLFAGVTLGYLRHFKRPWFEKLTGNYALLIAAICCIPALFVQRLHYQVFGLTMLFIGYGFLLAWSVDRKPRTRLGAMVLASAAQIGFYSYSIYLWHPLVLNVISSHFRLSCSVFWLSIALCVAVGIGLAELIEKPSLAWRDKKYPPAAATGPAEAVG